MSPPSALERNASAEPVAEDLVAPGTSTFDASGAGVEPDRGLAPVPDACVRADFAAWLERTAVAAAECSRWVEVVPTVRGGEHRRRGPPRAEAWLDFAGSLEQPREHTDVDRPKPRSLVETASFVAAQSFCWRVRRRMVFAPR
jgi:hypothetical protein